jgi:hypothetical protein
MAVAYMDACRKHAPGAPSTEARKVALEALDLRGAAVPQPPWDRIAHQLCNCGRTRHQRKCAERIRAQTIELRKFIDRMEKA